MRTFNLRTPFRTLGPLGLLAIVSAFAACTTMGTGVGTERSGDMKANFAWKSTDDRTGTLTANLSNGDTYSGQFFQVTHDTRVETLAPLWNGWAGPWHGWRYWGPYPDTAFVTHYSGRVVANLADGAGEHMRCHFTLMHPQNGMSGGGEGQCQLPSGQTIDATFANS
ncbi:MAG TPA: hypothetical protein VJ303_08205 [Steroidobacteraceae bacterium]|nr:hypothetical protein [Steroidobacteraceae bacterium]